MKVSAKVALLLTASIAQVSVASANAPVEAVSHVIDESALQAKIEQQVSKADQDKADIQALLQRPDVRQVATTAGLDLARASAAAAVLSGTELERLAAQARDIDARLAGGDTIVISATAIIIVLLILILVTN